MKIRLFLFGLLAVGGWFWASSHRLQAANSKLSISHYQSSIPLANSPVNQLTSYDQLWKKVDSLSDQGLPKSALEIVNRIYSRAKSEKNDPQFIKAILYRIKLKSDFEEGSLVKSIHEVNAEIRQSGEPVRQILNSILAELYWRYYQENRYRFNDRTEVSNNMEDSIQTWDLTRLSRKIIKTYMISLENPVALQGFPVRDYSVILEGKTDMGSGQKSGMRRNVNNPEGDEKESSEFNCSGCRPTLYDFLSWRALDYFMSEDGPKTVSATNFRIDRPFYFLQARQFTGMQVQFPPDSSSLENFAIRIFRDLASFHLMDKDPLALIDAELQRFEYVRAVGSMDAKDSLYSDALQKLEQSYLTTASSTDVSYAIGQFLFDQGQLFRPLESEKHKWDLKNALSCCENAIQRFPESDGTRKCKNLKEQILRAEILVTTENAVIPGKPSLALLEFRNLPEIHFRIVKTDPEKSQDNQGTEDNETKLRNYLELPVVQSWMETLPNDGDYHQHKIEFAIPELPEGYYLIICSSGKDFIVKKDVIAYSAFFSTRISYISQKKTNGGVDFYLLDRETGKPLKNAAIESFTRNYNYSTRAFEKSKTGDYLTDQDGFFSIPPAASGKNYSGLYLKIRIKNDLFLTQGFSVYPILPRNEKPVLKTFFFTDRAVFRPGQTLYLKGILTEKTGDRLTIQPGVRTTVTLYDVNHQKVSDQTFTTNEFGSFNGSFTIPQGVLLGQMMLTNGSGTAYFQAEEYKRPTFEVTFDPQEGNYRLNEALTIKGKALAYAGNNLDGANVKYRVTRAARFPFWDRWWIPFPLSPETEIVNGSLKTGNDGSFAIRFSAIPDNSIDKTVNPVFDYVVYADVTDINGETQSSQTILSVGYISLLIGTTIPDKLNLLNDSVFKLTTTNLNGRATPSLVQVTIQRLRQPDRVFKNRLWEKPDLTNKTRKDFHSQFPYDVYDDEDNPAKWPVGDTVLGKMMNSASDTVLNFREPSPGNRQPASGILKPGTYLLTLRSKDPFGQDVEKKSWFTVFNPISREVPVQEMNWFVPLKTEGEPGEKAQFLVGSKEEDVRVIYEVRLHDTLITKQWLTINDNQLLVEIPIRENYRGNFSVNFLFVRHNRVFQNSQVVKVPFTNKKLDITFESFRNKLYPGQQEEWKIRIADASKKAAAAEYLTTMYDASLDVFRSNHWDFSIFPDYTNYLPWEIHAAFSTSNTIWSLYPATPVFETREKVYDRLNWFGFSYFGGVQIYRRGLLGGKYAQPMAMDAATEEKSTAPVVEETVSSVTTTGSIEKSREEIPGSSFSGIQVRRDFRETAFFYPSLVTDSAGSLSVKFIVPESLTKWKIMGLGYSKDLCYGQIEKDLVTRKDLMVFPNSPRFVRQGDTVVLSAKVVNLSDRALSGEVTLEVFNGLTQKPVNLILASDYQLPGTDQKPEAGSQKQQLLTLPLGESSSFSWTLAIPEDPSLGVIQYRIVAKAGNFSDGEEKALPVLTNRMLVTESMPLPVRGTGSFDFTFNKLVKSTDKSSLKNYNLTLEFASNPAWYAIQALPVLDEPKYPSADNIFYAFYANSIASFIANSNPSIKQVFESWKNSTPDALLSNLEKNEQLKSALLKETPWVLEGKSESERKQRLGLLFDLNNLSNRLNENLKKLEKLQQANGGWTWFEGMPENRYITQNILTGLAHLSHLGITDISQENSARKMVLKAIAYLDGEIVRDYDNIRKHDPSKMDENHLSGIQIQYLYARSYFTGNQKLMANIQPAFDYFRKQAEKYWTKQDVYFQGMIALALNRLGNKEVPKAILKSLSEKALHSPEMGMYWAYNTGYYWYQAPVETQALLIEAYDEIAGDMNAVDEMKIWLLKQKQTQDWKTSRATAEACYALLLRGTDFLAIHPRIKISVGKEVIEPEKLRDNSIEAGTGYFQVSWPGKEILPEMGNVKVQKDKEGVAWGALYWQYFEDLDKITTAETPLKVEKQLYIERNTKDGPVLEEITKYEIRNTNEIKNDSTDKTHHLSTSSPQHLTIGDKLKVRIILKVDRNLEFVHLKDMRASAFEPYLLSPGGEGTGMGLSGYRYQDGLGYYQSTTDVATHFFFDYLPKGTWVFEYPLVINASGDYSNGIATVQCLYAPEFSSHSEGIRVKIEK